MSEQPFTHWDVQVLDLALDQVTVGLDAAASRDLRGRVDAEEFEELEFAAAAVHLAGVGMGAGERRAAPAVSTGPSADFLSALEQRGKELIAEPAPPVIEARRLSPPELPSGSRKTAAVLAFTGWLAAAGLLALVLVRGGAGTAPATPEADVLRAELVASAADLTEVTWGGTEDPLATDVSGDVVWSSERQEGYLRFRGLAANDPALEQYQLWIFDPTRADWEAKPIDGGVFDVPEVGAGGRPGEVVVPIDAKLEVREAVLFAVTLEKPGGVVVSERERLIVTAGV